MRYMTKNRLKELDLNNSGKKEKRKKEKKYLELRDKAKPDKVAEEISSEVVRILNENLKNKLDQKEG